MCSIAIAALAISTVSAGASFVGQRRQASKQKGYQAQASAAERQRFLQEQSAMRMRQAQENEASNREMADISLKSREAVSRARTSAGESGVAGASIDALLDDYTRQEADYRVATMRQQELRDVNTGLALTDAGYRTQNNLIGINRPINKPSFMEGVLSTASSAVSGYRTGLEIKKMDT
tara:strand:+ start:882 stop:1415 length:534 start_codon:yes stop_codon:yes gene_type:complete